MAARHTAQERRAASRAGRRKPDPDPQVEEETVPSETAETIWEAASAAIVGAAVGAAQAIARQREEARADEDFDEPETQEPSPQNVVPESEIEPEPESESEPEPEPEPAPEPESEPGRPGDAPKMVQRARQQLRELRGVEPESVSGIARTASGWRIGFEVVEVHRIPESTDVLGTYELELDADGELLGFERTQRYYRSEAERR